MGGPVRDSKGSWDFQLKCMEESLPPRGYLFYDEEEDKKYDAILAKNPQDYKANYAKGLLYFDREPDTAMKYFSRAIAAKPFEAAPLYTRGRKHLTKNEIDAALADLTQAIRIDDQVGWMWHYKGVALFFLERWEEARDTFINAMTVLRKHDGELLNCETDWLWMTYVNMGDYASAKKLLDDYDVNTPNVPIVGEDGGYKKRVLLLKGEMSPEDYREIIAPTVVNEGGPVNDWHALARYYYHIEGNLEEALKCLDEVVKPRPGNYTWSWGYRYAQVDRPQWEANPVSPYRALLK